jgi:hypothetical protein
VFAHLVGQFAPKTAHLGGDGISLC